MRVLGLRRKINKIISAFFLVSACFFPSLAYSDDVDTLPPIIGPWSYHAIRCGNYIGPWTSEDEAAEQGAKIIYGPTGTPDGKSSGWGTTQHVVSGPCGSTNAYPAFNKMGIETLNYNHIEVQYRETLYDGMTIRRTRSITCPAGTVNTEYACKINKFIVYLPKNNPPPKCPDNPTGGNPVVIGTGSKFELTEPIVSGSLRFQFIYNNGDRTAIMPWYHDYQKNLRIIEPSSASPDTDKKSSIYTNRNTACVSGWNEIKAKVTDVWSIGAVARLNGKTCEIVNSGKVVNHLYFFIPDSFIPGALQLIRGDGSIISYEYYGGGSFRSVSGDNGRLEQLSIGEWQYSTDSGIVERYDQLGKLIYIFQRGEKQTLTYNQTTGKLATVSDTSLHAFEFSYNNNQLVNLKQENNKVTQYTYAPNGLLEKIINPDNTFRQFHYEDSRFPTYLTGVTDERGIRFASWTYDTFGRAIKSEHAGGVDRVSFNFNSNGSTTVLNALNKQTIYYFENIADAPRVVKVEGEPTTNCTGSNKNYTYTDEGWLASKTDWKGNKTTYQYNGKGQEISRTEAFGTPIAKTITTEWHATLNLKTKITEPDKETIYNYDVNGLLTGQTTHSLVAQ